MKGVIYNISLCRVLAVGQAVLYSIVARFHNPQMFG